MLLNSSQGSLCLALIRSDVPFQTNCYGRRISYNDWPILGQLYQSIWASGRGRVLPLPFEILLQPCAVVCRGYHARDVGRLTV